MRLHRHLLSLILSRTIQLPISARDLLQVSPLHIIAVPWPLLSA